MKIKAVQMGFSQLAGWFAGFCLIGLVAGAQTGSVRISRCLQGELYGCCDCRFQGVEVMDANHCEFPAIQVQCLGYIRKGSQVTMFLRYLGDSHVVTIQHNEICAQDGFDYCRNKTGVFNRDMDRPSETFSCFFFNTALEHLTIGFDLNFDSLLPDNRWARGKLTSNPGAYPMLLGQRLEGLPVALFNLTWDSPPAEQGYYLYHRFTDQGEGSWSNSSLWVDSTGSSSLFQAGSLTLGQGIEIRVISDNCQALARVARDEHLGSVTLDPNLQALTFTWNRVHWPDILGPVNVTTPGQQPLDTDCQVVDNGQYHCTSNLSSTPPIGWLLIRAGWLPDAETLNYTALTPLWQMPATGWLWFAGPQPLSIQWQAPPVAADSYQVERLCQDTVNTTWVNNSHYMEDANGSCYQNCSFRILPVYRGSAYDELGIELTSVPLATPCLISGNPGTSSASLTTTQYQKASDSLVMTPFQDTSDSLVITRSQEISDSLISTRFQAITSALATTAPPMPLSSPTPLPSSSVISSAGDHQSGWEWPTLPPAGGITGAVATSIVVVVIVVACSCVAQVTFCVLGCTVMQRLNPGEIQKLRILNLPRQP